MGYQCNLTAWPTSGIPRCPPPSHLPRPWQSRTSVWSLWGGASSRLHPSTLWAAGRTTPSFAAGLPVSTQHPSPAALCWGAAATVRGSEAPGRQSIWQATGEGGNGKATGSHDECVQNERDRSGREGWWDRALATWSPAYTSKSLHLQLSVLP